ncbi:MAG TPA: TetR/AcrR family transcriptional regulator [Rhizomicrobium sp.]|jgi:AcrR family transcriptional regulator|nr:TetR/AcrR family transcriptional regulator [Rhizomicrobium sp.]
MRTGRPRSFCTDTVLDRALTVFWRHGYEGASIAELTATMGINAPSLYAAFGSKEGLFRATLKRYDDRRKVFMDEVLAATNAKTVARLFLEGVAGFAADTNGRDPPGCFSVQSGLSCTEQDIPEALAKYRAGKERLLRERFERARKEGDLPKSAAPLALARYLMAVANGMCVQASAGSSTRELLATAKLALAAWPVADEAKSKRRNVRPRATAARA